jgi:hypothetical protein
MVFAASLLAVIAACSADSALSPEAGLEAKGGNGGGPAPATTDVNVNGPVWVLGTFDFEITFQEGDPGENAHPQGKGECRDVEGNVNANTELNIVWYNSEGHETGAPFCAGGDSTTGNIECSIDATGLPATYAFGTGGMGAPDGNQLTNNENINFHSDLIPQQLDQFVHYGAVTKKGQRGNTTGKDWTAFTFTCGDGSEGDGYIDLSDFNALNTNLFGKGAQPAGSDRWLDVSGGITVHMYATGEGPFSDPPDDAVGEGELTSMYWLFRSRIPN